MKVDAFFEGGGILGISFIGAYKALNERGIYIDKAVGVSAGAIVASLIVAGYSARELIEILHIHDDFSFFKQKTKISEKNYIGKPLSILYKKGIYDSQVIEEFLEPLLRNKGISCFEDLRFKNESKLKVLTTDFTNKRLLIIPDDLAEYNIDPEIFRVSKAVRMSCAIPLFYTPVPLNTNNQVNYIIDGGVIRNVPTTVINKDGNLHNLTLRFRIKGMHNKFINSIIDFKNSYYIDNENKKLEKLIIIPNTLNIKATDFDIDKNTILELFKMGYKSTLQFLRNELY